MNLKSSFLMVALGVVPMLAQPLLSNAEEYTESYVVTGSHFEKPINQIGSDVTVITEDDFKKFNSTSVSDALRQASNVVVMQQANGTSAVFLRGGDSEYTLVLLDGIPMNDISAFGSFDFSSINLNNVDRIEIVQGAQAAIYGANALSGVINIITKKGSGELNGSARIQGGTPESYMASIQANAGTDKYSWTIGGIYSYANQISSYSKLQNGHEKDPQNLGSISASASLTPTDFFKVNGIFRYDHQRLDIDQGYDPITFDARDDDSIATVKRTFFSLSPSLIHLDGLWTQTLNMSYIDSKRNYHNDGSTDTNYESESVRIDWNHKLDLDWQQVAFGVTFSKDKQIENTYAAANAKDELENVALYAEYSVNPIDNLYITAAGRVDNYQSFTSKFSGSLSAAYTLEQTGTQFRASVGNAFKMLSLDEFTTNPELKPVDAFTWDIGFTQPLFDDKLELSATYYNARYSNFIENEANYWDPPKYVNAGSSTAHGIELGIVAKPIKDLRIAAYATFAETNISETDREQLRQPNSIYRVDLDYILPFDWYATYSLGASYKYVGERLDYNPVTRSYDFTAESYNLVDLRFKAALENGLNFYINLNNIFDEDYEEVTGYSSLGFNANFAVEYNF